VASIERTAYPRFKRYYTIAQLQKTYTPNSTEIAFARSNTQGDKNFFNLMVLLKSFQRLGYFPNLDQIPQDITNYRCFGSPTGIGFVDATSLKVCHNRRIKRHKVFDGLAARGKTSVDWFFGFKLHLVVNEVGQLLNAQLTPGNVDDRRPIPDLLQSLFGKFFADRGYVSQKLANQLLEEFGIQFFAKPRRNMKNKLMRLHDKLLSRQRSIIETINDQLKNISQIEHTRHRSPVNFCVNVLCGLIAYCHQPKKPSLRLDWLLPQSA